MGVDDAVDLGHEAYGFVKDHDDAVVMEKIFESELKTSSSAMCRRSNYAVPKGRHLLFYRSHIVASFSNYL